VAYNPAANHGRRPGPRWGVSSVAWVTFTGLRSCRRAAGTEFYSGQILSPQPFPYHDNAALTGGVVVCGAGLKARPKPWRRGVAYVRRRRRQFLRGSTIALDARTPRVVDRYIHDAPQAFSAVVIDTAYTYGIVYCRPTGPGALPSDQRWLGACGPAVAFARRRWCWRCSR